MQAITGTLWSASKVRIGKHCTSAPTYKEMKNKLSSTNNVEHGFQFCNDDIKHCGSRNKNEYLMEWSIVLKTWLLKIKFNISREKVLLLEHTMFQLQQKAFSPCCRLSTMQTIPIPFLNFYIPLKFDAHPPSRFPKKVHHNSTSHNKLGKCLTYGLIVPFCIKDFERSLKSSPGGYLLLCHNC